jgi:hypothetical protein
MAAMETKAETMAEAEAPDLTHSSKPSSVKLFRQAEFSKMFSHSSTRSVQSSCSEHYAMLT